MERYPVFMEWKIQNVNRALIPKLTSRFRTIPLEIPRVFCRSNTWQDNSKYTQKCRDNNSQGLKKEEKGGGEGRDEPGSVKRLGVVKLYWSVLCCIGVGIDKQGSLSVHSNIWHREQYRAGGESCTCIHQDIICEIYVSYIYMWYDMHLRYIHISQVTIYYWII